MSFSPLPIARPPGTGYSLTSGSTNPTASAHPVLSSSMPMFIVGTQEPCFPLPVSPKVLTCSPSPARDSRYAPHESFFAHASPRNPKIRIETGRKCYRLIMALPGYECNSMSVPSSVAILYTYIYAINSWLSCIESYRLGVNKSYILSLTYGNREEVCIDTCFF